MSDKTIGNETIHVLNNKYQYVSSDQLVNAQWLDVNNVVSVKRDKTIYAIRARTNYDFDNEDQNTEFFCNLNNKTGSNTTELVSSELYKNFNSNINNIFQKYDKPVYGNALHSNVSNIGWAGSLNIDYTHTMGASGSINVSPNVSVFANLNQRNSASVPNLRGNLHLDGNVKYYNAAGESGDANGNVLIANAYSTNKLFISNTATTKWNRLINANINSNVMVTASTDPCDMNGNAIHLSPSANKILANAQSNEAYRHQFALKKNNENVSSQNPIYIGRISRFGTSLTDISGDLSLICSVDSFTSNFFASLPSDNLVYGNPDNKLTEMSITGNYSSTDVVSFNSNYIDGNIGNINGVYPASNSLQTIVTLDKYESQYMDYLTNGNLTTQGGLAVNDRFSVVQTDLGITNPLYLFDRLKVESEDYKKASEIFTCNVGIRNAPTTDQPISSNPDLYAASANLNLKTEDAKVVHLSMYNIIANNWQSTNQVSPNLVMPELAGLPNMDEYTTGNTVQLYLRRGDVQLEDYSQINSTVPTTGSSYFNTIPSYLKSYSEPIDGIYINDSTVVSSGNLATASTSTTTYDVSDTLTITANISPDLCFYVYTNADINNRVDRRANVVIPQANTVISNIWSWDKNNTMTTSTVKFNPKIVYNNFDGLSVENPFAKKNLTYTVKFGKILGDTNLDQDRASNNSLGFYANLRNNGNVASSLIPNVATMNAEYSLTNNKHMGNLLFDGVAYSEYEFTDYSYKFTDLTKVNDLVSTGSNKNYQYTSVLPVVGNTANLVSEVKDNYMNVLVDYASSSLNGAIDDVHSLAIYDNHYRYYINNVKKTGGSTTDINTKYNAENSEDVFELFDVQGNIDESPLSLQNNSINPGSFLIYTYEKLNENASFDSFYPFSAPNETWTSRTTKQTNNDNYLFPGFVYKHSNEDAEFYNYKDETNCDFVIHNNIRESEKSISLVVFSADTTYKTLKVGLSTENSTKSINVRPIRIGGTNDNKNWYTPVVFKIASESNSYVVVLIKVVVDNNQEFKGLDASCSDHTPLVVTITSIEMTSDGQNQVQFKSRLQVYTKMQDSQKNLLYTNIVNSHKAQLSNFSYSSVYGSSTTNVGVNIYSIPVNNLVVFYMYTQANIKKIMSYTQTDYELDNSVNYDSNASEASRYKKINRPVSSLNFASSKVNVTASPVNDGNNPPIESGTTRFYLDQGYEGAIYVDYLNNSSVSLKNMGKLQLNRSVEWILTRQEEGSSVVETIGRGLISKNPGASLSITKEYMISENLGKSSSGFYMHVNTNVVDMASHLLLQKKQTGNLKMNTLPQFKLLTLSDNIIISLFHEDPISLSRTYIDHKTTSSKTVNLGELFVKNQKKSRLPTLEFDLVRSLSTAVINPTSVSNALFRLKIRLDNYSIVHNRNHVNGSNVVFSSDTNVNTLSLGVNLSTSLNRSLNSNFLNITNPSPFGNNHRLVKSFVHRGFGKVDMRVYDFTSHYGTELPSQALGSNSMSAFNFPSEDAYKFTVPNTQQVSNTKEIELDTTNDRYYINLGTVENPDKLYFIGNTQPTPFNNRETFLLYTGTRPLGFVTYEILSQTNFTDFKLLTPYTFKQGTKVFNSNIVSEVLSGNNNNYGQSYKVYYSVALTNRNGVDPILVRGVAYDFNKNEIFNINKRNYLIGTYRSLSSLLQDVKFTSKFGTSENTYDLTTTYIGSSLLTTGLSGKTDRYLTYRVSADDLGDVFKLKFHGSIDNVNNFKVVIDPSRCDIYQAVDVNENGELEKLEATPEDNNNLGSSNAINISTVNDQYKLDATFSELLYNLQTNPSYNFNYNRPKIVQTFNLDGKYQTIQGAGFDLLLNKNWSIGYNLDCFFTIRNNNVCTFDVITIDTDSQNNTSSVSSLKVQNSLPLVVGSKGSWARSKGYNDANSNHCGLTFKIKQDASIKSGSIVRLFVDNTPLSNNLEVGVSVAGKDRKSYKLSDYDNETYSRLLDKQMKLKNSFE